MQYQLLRSKVNAVALVVASLVALALPVGYLSVTHFNETNLLRFKAEITATRIARYAYANEKMWTYHKVRLAEIIDVDYRAAVEQRVLNSNGKEVLVNGAVAGYFRVAASAPIQVGGAAIGRVVLVASFDAFVLRTGLVAVLGLALASAAYFAVRMLPLRALDRTLGDLKRANRNILDVNAALQVRSDQLAEAHRLGRLGDWTYRFGERQLRWTPETFELLRYDPSAFVPTRRAVLSLLSENDTRRVRDILMNVLRTGVQGNADIRARRGDGSVGEFAVVCKRLLDPDGRVVGISGAIQDISERKLAEQQLEKLAYYDPLTGLANRALFHRELAEALERCIRGGTSGVVMLLDLDRFKEVNDSLGHAAGDELLARVAYLLAREAGKGHLLARLGGDEFGVIMRQGSSDPASVERLAQSLLAAVSGSILLERGEVAIGTSIGIAHFPRDGFNSDDLLRNADLALYRAKQEGRGRFTFFQPEMSTAVQHKMELARELRRAIAEDAGLAVHYQPQIDLSNGRVAGFEALMRWNHPTLGIVPPSEFIPIAESSRLICDLGFWILHRAAAQAKAWLDAGEPPRQVAVNVSAAQIWHTDLVGDVRRVLGETGLPPHLLCLELTESLLIDHTEARVRTVLKKLKALGISLALDDFGTNYSSLGYLIQLPFDKLKIDRVFVANSPNSHRSRELLRGIVALGRGLGMTVYGEGAEQPGEVALLRELGCDLVQGYVFARPSAAADALDFAHVCEAGQHAPACVPDDATAAMVERLRRLTARPSAELSADRVRIDNRR